MKYKNINDYELIYYIAENNDYSYDSLFNKYLPIIKSIANRFFKVYMNFEYDYEDFFQEACIGFQKSVKCYNEMIDSTFYSFCTLCIERHLISYCRKLTSITKNCSKDLFNVVDDYDDVFKQDKFEDNVMSHLVLKDIYNIVVFDSCFEDGLVFELKCNGFTFAEINTLLGIPITTASHKFNKLKKKFLDLHYLYK